MITPTFHPGVQQLKQYLNHLKEDYKQLHALGTSSALDAIRQQFSEGKKILNKLTPSIA